MKRRYYDYATFLTDIKQLTARLKEERFDYLIAISRGALTMTHFVAMALDMRNVEMVCAVSYNGARKQNAPKIERLPELRNAKKALILDEIIDSGETMTAIAQALKERYPQTEFKIAALFQKSTASISADFFVRVADEWIDYFWEVDPIA
ncbi:MAG: phosphoribosyltransferase [Helicobacteraceae bacterium]|jgi:xanthine phosphoribosyltransferase|nr:phosphoribosyltransferase [Helicobacteraceae bacterium]